MGYHRFSGGAKQLSVVSDMNQNHDNMSSEMFLRVYKSTSHRGILNKKPAMQSQNVFQLVFMGIFPSGKLM